MGQGAVRPPLVQRLIDKRRFASAFAVRRSIPVPLRHAEVTDAIGVDHILKQANHALRS